MIPEKLKIGDEIRVVAPSRSMQIIGETSVQEAIKALEELGFKVTFGKHVNEVMDEAYMCASVQDRVEDIQEAFTDKQVKAILTVIGGFNVNQILDYLDYETIRQNPKIICGLSDITALTNAIYAKTGLVTYSGPHFSTFGMQKGVEYTIEYFKKMFMPKEEITIEASKEWSNDAWFMDQENRKFYPNKGMHKIQEGEAQGTIIGGNLCTLNLLQGTDYMPDLTDSILFLEDDGEEEDNFFVTFDRDLQSLLHSARGKMVKGIVFGRAEKICQMTNEKWETFVKIRPELKGIPVICNADFGHTTPIFTFPIGGTANLQVKEGKIELKIKG